jgi:hypothetical protein
MKEFDKQGAFYLGKEINAKDGSLTDSLFLYDSKNFTTHAVCVGMTGSGKTGLGITILEEAALDSIPAIIIDPKGDLANLALTFPSLDAKAFEPWIDSIEAEKKGVSVSKYAKSIAETWKEGLQKWGEGSQRIQKFKNTVDVVIYTPASKAGVPLSILNSFTAPSKEANLDSAAVRDRVLSTTSSLLGLLGMSADPIKSREHILISTIISQAWDVGKDLDIASLIKQVQIPPFSKVGVLDIDTFYPPKDRLVLSISLNNLLASPGFQAWMEGEPLDVSRLLHTTEGKPKLSVISIAHLSDAERMFFVTLLLNELLTWMRRQSGTSSLRAIFYMDEIFGYFPPTAMPPSKIPMLTLLKQARAFGLGVILCTQNPADLDYKGLANSGTWFIGKLQTERDKSRVLEGLTIASNGELKARELDKMLSLVGARTFIIRSIYLKDPVIFQTRWTLSYLRGPLTLSQVAKLTNYKPPVQKVTSKNEVTEAIKPLPPIGIAEYFLRIQNVQKPVHYAPELAGFAKLHFVDAKSKIDTWQDVNIIASFEDDGLNVNWNKGESFTDLKRMLEDKPLAEANYEELPAGLMQKKNLSEIEKKFAAFLYQNQVFKIFKLPEVNLNSKEGETEGEFRARAALALREKRDELVAKLKAKYADKIAVLTEKARKAEEKVSMKKKKWWLQMGETFISFITAILGALLGKGVTKTTISQTGTSMRKIGRITKESEDAYQAENNYTAIQEQLDLLKSQMEDEIQKASQDDDIKIETIDIRPRKNDVLVEKIALVWQAKQ